MRNAFKHKIYSSHILNFLQSHMEKELIHTFVSKNVTVFCSTCIPSLIFIYIYI